MKFTIPYLTSRRRAGRDVYLWQPSSTLRKKGWKSVALKNAAGGHSDLETAMAQAGWLNAILSAWRIGDLDEAKAILDAWHSDFYDLSVWPDCELTACTAVPYHVPGLVPPPAAKNTVAALFREYQASPEFEVLAPKTRTDYRSRMNCLAETFGDCRVPHLTRLELRRYYGQTCHAKSRVTANARIRVFSTVLSYAVELGYRADNPLLNFRMKAAAPRLVIWSPANCQHFVHTADNMGELGIADAFVLGLYTAQRRGDLLRLRCDQFENGRILLRQGKTGSQVDIPFETFGPLTMRIADMLVRHVRSGASRDMPIVLDQNSGQPFKESTFGHRFAAVREKADIYEKRFGDLRATAITRLALAQLDQHGTVDLTAIAAISGHALPSVTRILRHYLAMDRRMADKGMAALSSWMTKEGIKL